MFALYLFKYNLNKVFQCKLGRFKSNSIGVDIEPRAAFFSRTLACFKMMRMCALGGILHRSWTIGLNRGNSFGRMR